MNNLTYVLSIALITVFGVEKAESPATEYAQIKKEAPSSISESSVSNSETSYLQEKINCDSSKLAVIWDDPDQSGTNIRNSPGGKVIAKINPSDFPDGCMFEIVEASNGWLRIQGTLQGPDNEINLPNDEGWIHNSVVSIGTRNYSGHRINILDAPNSRKSVGSINIEVSGLRIIDLCGNWVKISYRGITGWVSSDWLCGIPWTNCC